MLMIMRSRDPACAPRRSSGFSLIELLVVVALIAVLLTGGNLLFLDGHVIWRPFDQMKLRGGPNELWF
jgi:prepilin-type N-terminal cleavage/methylation domain-containing protein